jgi:hypothetical protein
VPGKLKKDKKSKKEKDTNSSGVGLPYNVKHKQHVNFDFTWTGQKAEDLFEIKHELGKGYVLHSHIFLNYQFLWNCVYGDTQRDWL